MFSGRVFWWGAALAGGAAFGACAQAQDDKAFGESVDTVTSSGGSGTSSTTSPTTSLSTSTTATQGSGGSSGGSGGSSSGGASSGGSGGSGGDDTPGGAAGQPAGTGGTGGGAPLEDECETDADCAEEGRCVLCQTGSNTVLECVDQGPSSCDGGERDACELCDGADLGDITSCLEVGEPGEFSGGTLACNETCDGYDTTGCSVCSNDITEDGEACDGEDVPSTNCADLRLPPPEVGDDVDLPCLETCEFDTSGCQLCSVEASDCLMGDDASCSGNDCSGKQCAAGDTCDFSCTGQNALCEDMNCNMSATCSVECGFENTCNIGCEEASSCEFACATNGTCVLGCGADATCDMQCEYNADCAFACSAGANCAIKCPQPNPMVPGGACEVACVSGSSCSVDATNFEAEPTGDAYCADGDNCSYDCGTSADCRGLNVTCEAGSTCAFTCSASSAICPTVLCEAGASCNFDCDGIFCNEPTCENLEDCECTGSDCEFQTL